MRRSTIFGTGFLAILAIVALASAEDPARRLSPVTREEVDRAVARDLMTRLPQTSPLPPWDFDVPLAVPAAGPHAIRVASVCRETNEELRFELACAEPGACLHFLAYVRIAARVPASACGAEPARETASSTAPAMVRPGDRATALWAVPGLRMVAMVTSLERGASGAIIRVRGRDGRVLLARVTGPKRVEVIVQ